MGNLFQGWHLIVLLGIVLLLFGAPKLPGLAKSIGQSMRIFRSEVKTMQEENKPAEAASTPPASTPAASSAVPTNLPNASDAHDAQSTP